MSKSLTLDLPDDLVEAVRSRVSAGEFADESEVIADALRRTLIDDEELEHFLRTEVVASIEAHAVDPSGSVSMEELMPLLRERHRARQGKA